MEQRQFNEISNPLNYNYSTRLNSSKKTNLNLSMNLINYDKKSARKKVINKLETKDTYLPNIKLRSVNSINNICSINVNKKQMKMPFKMILQTQTEQLLNRSNKNNKKNLKKFHSKSNLVYETIELTEITGAKIGKNKLILPPILSSQRKLDLDSSVIETARKLNDEVDIGYRKLSASTSVLKLPSIQVIFKSEPVLDLSIENDLNSLKSKAPVKLPFVKLNKLKLNEQRKKSARKMWFHYDSLSFTP